MLLSAFVLSAAIAASTTPQPVEIAKGVVLIRGAFVPGQQPDGNSILLRTKNGFVVVDTGRHESHTRRIIDFAKASNAPVVAIVNTHWHLDHIGGNALLRREYPGVRVYASPALEEARKGFLENYHGQLVHAIEESKDPAARESMTTEMRLIENSAALAPDEVVAKAQKLDIGGRSLEIGFAKNAVTAGDLWLFDRSTSTLVAGDLITLPVPFLDTACPAGWSSALDEIAKKKFELVLPGHGGPMHRDEFETYRTAHRNLIACSASPAAKEVCIEGWLSDAKPLLKDDNPKFVRSLLDYYVGAVLRGDAAKLKARCGE